MRKRVVLDTNILVEFIDNAGPGFETLLRIMEKCDELEIASCWKMMEELFTTLQKRKGFLPKSSDMTVRLFIKTLEGMNKLLLNDYSQMNLEIEISEKDRYFCELAVQCQATYLISNDSHHFLPVKEPMKELYGVNVLSSSEFLENEGHVEDWEKMRSLMGPNFVRT
ncbi:MAG: putative toxin-antitoxin system toxin component, PIN family [Candidatus Odinarchaeota archaeon]